MQAGMLEILLAHMDGAANGEPAEVTVEGTEEPKAVVTAEVSVVQCLIDRVCLLIFSVSACACGRMSGFRFPREGTSCASYYYHNNLKLECQF